MKKRELVIIGGGPAGLAAALSAYTHGVRDILILERDQYLGGILNQCIHTGFGIDYFNSILTGPEYAHYFINKIQKIPAIEVSLRSFVIKLTANKKVTYLKPGCLTTIQAKSVILATGCRERTREMIHIPGTRPSGIFSAGLAQKLINLEGLLPGTTVAIIGSGDIGLIMARRFVLEGARVSAVVEIQDTCSGLERNIVQCLDDFNIPLFLRHKVSKIFGKNRVEGITLVKVDDDLNEINNTDFFIPCDTVLLSVGLIPENELCEIAGVLLDKKTNTPISKELNTTSIPGLFVCGNAYQVYDYVDSVTVDSERAGQQAARYVGYHHE